MTPAAPRWIIHKLGFQIAFLLAIVLLPLTAISMISSSRAGNEMRARSEAALTGQTMLAAANEVRLIHEARGTAAALASVIGPILQDKAACLAVVRSVALSQPQYSQVSFFPRDGQLRCSSTGKEMDLSQSEIFQATVAAAKPGFSVNRNGALSGTSVLGVTHPVFDPQGVYLGYVGLSLPHSTLNLVPSGDAPKVEKLDLMTFDADGEVLVASVGLENAAQALPRDRSLAALNAEHPLAFSGLSVAGEQRVFSFVPIVPGELYVLGSWPVDQATRFDDTLISIPILLPALIWVISLIVAWLAVEWLVNRPIRRLNLSIRSFAGGNRLGPDVNVEGAPLEIREMASAYEQMTDSVMRDEAELEDTVHQMEVLLREVHHRVKNNLQMIASIMNMHLRKASTTETKEVIKGLQGRVMSLAAIHRELYQTTGVTDVYASELLDAIARQVINFAAGPNQRFDLRTELAGIQMTPDQAVPLALLVNEGLMNCVRYANSTGSGASVVELRLALDAPDRAIMEIRAPIDVEKYSVGEGLVDGAGLGPQLMQAFAMQLGGKLDVETTGGKYHLRAEFDLRPLVEAENRHAPKMPEHATPDAETPEIA